MEGAVAGWSDFLTAVATTAGALVGLVFVALSINLARIIALPEVAGRAAETIILLSGTLAETLIALVPHLSRVQLGWALLLVALLTWAMPVIIQLRAALAHTVYRRSLAVLRTRRDNEEAGMVIAPAQAAPLVTELRRTPARPDRPPQV